MIAGHFWREETAKLKGWVEVRILAKTSLLVLNL